MYRILVVIGVVSLTFFSMAGRAAENSWQAGVAKTRITPEGEYWMGGYASRTKPSEGTDLDLWAKALALQDGDGGRVVVVTLDLLVVTPEISAAVLGGARYRYGLEADQVLLNCSHTHCGPEVRLYRESLHNIPKPLAEKMHQYVDWLGAQIVDLIGESLANLKPSQLSIAGDEAAFAINRRENRGAELMKRAATGTLKGPVDHDVPVLRVTNADDKVLAIVFGYACHNTIMSFFRTSGDYAGYAQKFIEEDHPGAVAMFVMGAGGDQNPHPRREQKHLALHGRALADAVNRALQKPQTDIGEKLRTARRDATLAIRPAPDRAVLEKQLEDKNQYKRWKAGFLLGQFDPGVEATSSYDLPVQAIRLGNEVLLVASGGEVVVDYSLRFKSEFANPEGWDSAPTLWFAGYSGDVSFYLPSLRVLKEGGYEGGEHMVYTQFTGPFEADVEQRVFDAIRQVVERVSE